MKSFDLKFRSIFSAARSISPLMSIWELNARAEQSFKPTRESAGLKLSTPRIALKGRCPRNGTRSLRLPPDTLKLARPVRNSDNLRPSKDK
ncbi:MAG: hypothetical protein ACD_47C00018G0002 [uncultured bacterium]|nr:MAG: hypothetical protein ACD_47C00018G0002 [uncultured bacterium]